MMFSKVRGFFNEYEVAIDFDQDVPENSALVVTIETASASTRDDTRDGHLRSPEFFNVEEYPTATFRSTGIVVTGKNRDKLTGELTITGITKEIALDVEYLGTATNPSGGLVAAFTGTTTIDRRDWGLVWNEPLDTGGVLAGWLVQIDVELQLAKMPEQVAPLGTA
jgi:polyisoprenoid-binding protein YceI